MKVEQSSNLHNLQSKSMNSKPNLRFFWTLSSLSLKPQTRGKAKEKRGMERCPRKKIIANDLSPAAATLARSGRATSLAGRVVPVVGRATVRLHTCPCLASFARFALFLVSRASSNLYSSPQSSQNANFANKIRRFSLKAQKSRNVSKIA